MTEEISKIEMMIDEIRLKNYELTKNMTNEEWLEHYRKITEEQKKEFKNLRFISNISEL